MNKKIGESGILMHITSLPGANGIGDLGKSAYEFVDFLHSSGQKFWQILPLNIPDFSNSPYQSPSAFANHPGLISLVELLESGLLKEQEIVLPQQPHDVKQACEFKAAQLRVAYSRFVPNDDYVIFCKKQAFWLEDYALFMALKRYFNSAVWNTWLHKLAVREESVLAEYRQKLSAEISYHKFAQYVFYEQWMKLKDYANDLGIKIIGDVPIFIAFDSADVWANQELFDLDRYSNPKTVAGVPPDYFSSTGQLWGNPHYNWAQMALDEYQWWRNRISMAFKMTDVVRIDHFRGFAGYWAVPYGDETAVNGSWVEGPGEDFFAVLEKYLGKCDFIAEDLGVITDDVVRIKERFNLPGMKILQFDINISENGHVGFGAEPNSVVYTGTHDNNTTLGWYQEELGVRKQWLQRAFNTDSADKIGWKLIELAYASAAHLVIVPMQDFLMLDGESRMNLPGSVQDQNWRWQAQSGYLSSNLAEKIKRLVVKYHRL